MSAAPPDEPAPGRPRRPPAPDPSIPRRWAQFREDHASWLEGLPRGEPVYRLPKVLIDTLWAAKHIDDAAQAAELALGRLCARASAAGFHHDGTPVAYPFLAPGSAEPAARPSVRSRDSTADGRRLGDADLRLKACAARLVTDPAFVRDFEAQRARWAALPEDARPRFPIRRDGLDPGPPGPGAAFATAFAGFCDRWALAGAATWDLPVPLGPVVSGAPPASTAPRPRGVYAFIPIHHDLDGDARLPRELRRAHRAQALASGLADAAAGPPGRAGMARMFEILHWERVASARYRTARRTSGFVADLVRGLAGSLRLSEGRVRKWRKAASARLRRRPATPTPPPDARP
ncbi:hypothetical protein [Paludisphaera mucosa]|uniref:Uncharacterized protein n=1 Tax=Paludisphaera mucosa TaxID=3030827 RepID=A0ABT6FLD5_9BACT|nr:hypothetical protein [Paludisphaera mucosa]MDG3008385.1 hypothetical protein [Paludisphaera mucosa]